MKTFHSRQTGFTIVELLIVIIVIGILSGIILVSYSGAVSSSNTQSAKANASSMQRKIEAYGQVTNSFPDATTITTYTNQLNSHSDSTLESSDLEIGAPNGTNGKTTVEVSQCSTNPGMAYRIRYWDFTDKVLSDDVITGSLSASACTSWTVLR